MNTTYKNEIKEALCCLEREYSEVIFKYGICFPSSFHVIEYKFISIEKIKRQSFFKKINDLVDGWEEKWDDLDVFFTKRKLLIDTSEIIYESLNNLKFDLSSPANLFLQNISSDSNHVFNTKFPNSNQSEKGRVHFEEFRFKEEMTIDTPVGNIRIDTSDNVFNRTNKTNINMDCFSYSLLAA